MRTSFERNSAKRIKFVRIITKMPRPFQNLVNLANGLFVRRMKQMNLAVKFVVWRVELMNLTVESLVRKGSLTNLVVKPVVWKVKLHLLISDLMIRLISLRSPSFKFSNVDESLNYEKISFYFIWFIFSSSQWMIFKSLIHKAKDHEYTECRWKILILFGWSFKYLLLKFQNSRPFCSNQILQFQEQSKNRSFVQRHRIHRLIATFIRLI